MSERIHLKAPFPENFSAQDFDEESLQAVFGGQSKWLQNYFVAPRRMKSAHKHAICEVVLPLCGPRGKLRRDISQLLQPRMFSESPVVATIGPNQFT